MSQTIAFIFARGGSKGLPGKNIKLLAGKPLIGYSIEVALASPSIDRVIVSTDDEAIAEVARRFGAEVPFIRPAELAGDRSPEWLAWQHAVRFVIQQNKTAADRFTRFVSLPATAPLRSISDIERAIGALAADTDMVITVKPAERNPYFNMVVTDKDGYAKRVIEPGSAIAHRQTAPEVFDMATVAYVSRPDFILSASGVFDGKVKSVLVPKVRAVDIDDKYDFAIAEALLPFAMENQPL